MAARATSAASTVQLPPRSWIPPSVISFIRGHYLDFVDRDGAIFALSQIKPGLYWGPSGDGHHLQYIHWRGKPILVIAIGHLAGFNVIANSNNPAPRTDIKIELLRPFDVEKLRDLHDICRRPFDKTAPLMSAVRSSHYRGGKHRSVDVLDPTSVTGSMNNPPRISITDLLTDDLVMVAVRVCRQTDNSSASSGWFEIDTVARLHPRPL
ncbi:hypothetical protein C8Q76DRAFT_690220 [Earliella scabrosa]|nr:hypothetical protein C8Q76DRAFT_690220 [Earliella scabrosa]